MTNVTFEGFLSVGAHNLYVSSKYHFEKIVIEPIHTLAVSPQYESANDFLNIIHTSHIIMFFPSMSAKMPGQVTMSSEGQYTHSTFKMLLTSTSLQMTFKTATMGKV